jgi:hypothetical protein
MNSEHYRIAQLCRKEMMSDPGKLTKRSFDVIGKILQHKKKPIMSWYLLYLKSISKALGFPGMEDYKPPSTISGVKVAYMLNIEDFQSTVPKDTYAYANVYYSEEEKFVETYKGKNNHAIAYLNTMYFFYREDEKQPDEEYLVVQNQDNSLLTKADE